MSAVPVRLPRMLTVEEVAEQLRISTKTVRRMIESGVLHAHRIGRRVRVSAEDLAAFLSARRR